jgi:hypothetical protein
MISSIGQAVLLSSAQDTAQLKDYLVVARYKRSPDPVIVLSCLTFVVSLAGAYSFCRSRWYRRVAKVNNTPEPTVARANQLKGN